MRAVPAISQALPAPSFVGLARMRFEAWRLRRIVAGLNRATARGDASAMLRWVARSERALADIERAQDGLRPRRPPRRFH